MKLPNFGFELKTIKELRYEYEDLHYFIEEEVDLDEIDFEVSFDANLENDELAIFFHTRFIYPIDKKTDYEIMHSDILFTYSLYNEDKVIRTHDDNNLSYGIPKNFIEIMFSLVYSTARGYIACKTKGTYLDNILLPIALPNELIKLSNGIVENDFYYIQTEM